MAQTLETILDGRIDGGLVSVKDGHAVTTRNIEVRQAGHPLPDGRSTANGQAILDLVQGLSHKDLVLCLISGGGSALMESLMPGLTLDHLRAVTTALLARGATIAQLNMVRKHLSRIKGGRLAVAAQPARLCSLILSDVVGDDLPSVASGPTCPDPTTYEDALRTLGQFGLQEVTVLREVVAFLERGRRGEIAETPKPGDALFSQVVNVVVGSNRSALDAAEREARLLGYDVRVISTSLEGEAREVGTSLAEIARKYVAAGIRKCCLLAGGETTVTIRGSGQGGRNQELALAAAVSLDGVKGVSMLSAATDGGDGSSDAAGAIVDGTTIERAHDTGLDARFKLDRNDSHHFFSPLGDQVITGPTLTNVNDIVILLIA